MILRYATFLLLATSTSVHAQDLFWLHSEPVGWGMNYQMPNHIVRASANGVVGATRGFGPGMSFGQAIFSSISVDWIDPDTGIPFASCSMSDSVTVESMVVAGDGTIYVAGRFMGGIQFCDGNAAGGTSGFLDTDLFLAAFSGTTFGVEWVRNISMAHPDGQGIPALELDADGTLWYGLEEFSTIRLISVDALGADDEEITINGTRSLGGFAFDAWNNLYVTGSAEDLLGPLQFGGLSVPVTGTYGLFVLRIRADGSGHWAEIAHAETFHDPDIAVDSWGKAVISSSLLDSTSFGALSFNGPNWVFDVFVAQVDSTGEFLWGHESAPATGPITGDMLQSRMTSVACDGLGNVYFTGTARGLTDWGNGVVSDAITLGAYAQTVVAFNNNGMAQWALTSMPGSINAQAVSCDEAGAVYFTGHVNGPYTMASVVVNNGGQQAFVDGRIDQLSTSIPASTSVDRIQAWPIPAGSQVMINVIGFSSAEPATIVTATGQDVMRLTLQPGLNVLDISSFSAGLYLLRGANGSTTRLIKE